MIIYEYAAHYVPEDEWKFVSEAWVKANWNGFNKVEQDDDFNFDRVRVRKVGKWVNVYK